MRTVDLDIHGLCGVRIKNHSRGFFAALNRPLVYFERALEREPDIELTIGDFEENLKSASVVDHEYFVKKGSIFFEDNIRGAEFKISISGFEKGRFAIRASAKKTPFCSLNRFYPDRGFYDLLLFPIVERVLLAKGILFLHAGCVTKNGKTIILAGRGGARKTSLVMNLVKKGFSYLGDGWVIAGEEGAYSFPTCPIFFNYRVRHMKSENPGFLHVVKILPRLINASRESPYAKDFSPISALCLVYVKDTKKTEIEKLEKEEDVSEALFANNALEWKVEASGGRGLGRVFEAYEYVHTDVSKKTHEDAFRECAVRILKGKKTYRVSLPLRWSQDNVIAIEKALDF